MKNNQKLKKSYIGAGFFGTSMREVMLRASMVHQSKKFPLGATWPFVRLDFDDKSVTCKIGWREMRLLYEDLIMVELTKIGYIVFHSSNIADSFGFASLRINTIEKILLSHSVQIDTNFSKQKVYAFAILSAQILLPVATICIILFKGLQL